MDVKPPTLMKHMQPLWHHKGVAELAWDGILLLNSETFIDHTHNHCHTETSVRWMLRHIVKWRNSPIHFHRKESAFVDTGVMVKEWSYPAAASCSLPFSLRGTKHLIVSSDAWNRTNSNGEKKQLKSRPNWPSQCWTTWRPVCRSILRAFKCYLVLDLDKKTFNQHRTLQFCSNVDPSRNMTCSTKVSKLTHRHFKWPAYCSSLGKKTTTFLNLFPSLLYSAYFPRLLSPCVSSFLFYPCFKFAINRNIKMGFLLSSLFFF